MEADHCRENSRRQLASNNSSVRLRLVMEGSLVARSASLVAIEVREHEYARHRRFHLSCGVTRG